MEHARPPPELQIDGNPVARADAWRKWWKLFEVFLKASGVNKEPMDVQASLLINLIGADGYEIFSTFTYTKEESADNLLCLKAKFDKHFGTKTNVSMLRFKFFTRNQLAGESISQYVTALRLLSQQCEFENLVDGLIRDRIVCGVNNTIVRDRMLRTDGLTLEKAIQICEAAECSTEENREIEQGATASVQVDALARGRYASTSRGGHGRRRGAGGSGAAAGPATRARQTKEQCTRCGNSFCVDFQRCPARNAKCFECNNYGHFARKCLFKLGKKVHGLNISQNGEELEESEEEETLYVDVLKSKGKLSKGQWIENLNINGMFVTFKLDCGADVNVISKQEFDRLGLKDECLEPHKSSVFSYTMNKLPIVGYCQLVVRHKQKIHYLNCAVVDMIVQNILGRDDCVALGFIKRIDMLMIELGEFHDLFQGIGEVSGLHKIIIDKSVQPIVCPARKIPFGIRGKLQVELQRMEKLGIICKVNYPTEWVNPIVIAAKKNGDIRVCLDARALNRAVKRAQYTLPTVSEIATKLRGARYYSVLDARCGFWMLKLDEASADLCTFSTPFGRYKFIRLPYGVSCAPEMFHAKVRQLLEDLEGIDSFSDDIIVWGCSKDEHDRRLRLLLLRARDVGIKFNKDKCRFGVTQITYLGHVFDESGMKPDQKKVSAILQMPEPKDRKSLERFLGMVNYLSKFIQNYSQTVAVLRNLLKKNSEWIWESMHSEAIKKLKHKLTTAPVLTLYSNELPIIVSVDASAEALGAVLLQEGRPVEFASLTLTETQGRYAQIEKELLAIVFACERFHQYIFGRTNVTVQSDHKPLESIFKKSLSNVPTRLQRMMLRLQAYDVKIVYTPGKYMYIADTLSRAALPELMHERMNDEIEAQTCFMLEQVQFSDEKLELVKKYTQTDKECELLSKYIIKGWPRRKNDIEESIRRYWSYRDELQYINGIIFKNSAVFVPQFLRKEMLNRIHEGHLGIDRSKRRARGILFWVGMSRDIEATVRGCNTCAVHAPAPRREPLMPHYVPDVPWFKVGSDIFEYRKKYYLILVDYFSNYVEVNELNNINSKCVILAMKEQFARYGIPTQLVTNNGPAYRSKEFLAFVKDWEIKHLTSSPMYAQSNGKSERSIRTVKTLLKKCIDSGHDYYISLLNFRTTPRDKIDSPAQLLMGRRLNTRLPIHKSMLSEGVDLKRNYKEIIKQQDIQKSRYDKTTKNLPPLRKNHKVVVADGTQRKPMTVVQKADEPRSYILQDAIGRKYRRNRRHLICRQPGLSERLQNDVDKFEDAHDTYVEVDKGENRQVVKPQGASGTADDAHPKQPQTFMQVPKLSVMTRAKARLLASSTHVLDDNVKLD